MHHTLPTEIRKNGYFIKGHMHDSGDLETLQRIDPAHGVAVSSVTLCTDIQVNQAVSVARDTFENVWEQTPAADRATILLKTAQGIRDNINQLAYWETLETGKPISQSYDEIAGAADHYEAVAGYARMITGHTHNGYGDTVFGMTTKQPMGVVGLITPWNFPFIVLAERLPYILAAGCTVVLKPSEMTSTTSLMLAEILQNAGLPDGVYNVVTGLGPQVGNAISSHKDIDMVSFTGSCAVGQQVMMASTTNFKKVALELGGKNPQIVFADSDLDDAADGIVFGLCFNAGQCCVSGSRLIVEKSVAQQLQQKIIAKLSKIKIGDSLDPSTQMGAIVSPTHYNKILEYIKSAVKQGASIALGGNAINSKGLFIAPTIFNAVTPDMPIARDEVFGPVLSVFTFDTVKQAIQIARDTDYGLSASVWSKNMDKAMGVIRKMRAGRCWINTTILGGPEQAIGGFKQSGIGRECGMQGIEEYMEIKSIHMQLGKREHWIK